MEINLYSFSLFFLGGLMGIWKMNTNVFLILCKSYVEKREAVNSLQEELANVQDHLNLTKQVSLTNVIFW